MVDLTRVTVGSTVEFYDGEMRTITNVKFGLLNDDSIDYVVLHFDSQIAHPYFSGIGSDYYKYDVDGKWKRERVDARCNADIVNVYGVSSFAQFVRDHAL